VVVADYQAAKLRRTCDELTSIDVPNLGVEVDIRDQDRINEMVASTVERFGKVDAIVNNAQTFRANAPMAEVSADDVDVFYRSGVLGSLWAMQAVYPHMKEAGWGRIVNFGRRWVASVARGSARTTPRRRRSGH
jgi:NADP-dependent 3-hydroxy acid dehydrogenase YdfG